MISQQSYSNQKAILFLVPTPIGNLEDMTYRAVRILREVDAIFCEDTRVTKVLLSHFTILTPCYSYHSFNEESRSKELLEWLHLGKKIALVSDAGLPGISDPGYLITSLAIQEGYSVISLPGANAALTALIASGLPSDQFCFIGFLASKASQRKKQLQMLQDMDKTLLFYEAPHRLRGFLEDAYELLGDRKAVVARELTKKHEEYIRGTLSELLSGEWLIKGEIVVIIEGAKETKQHQELLTLSLLEHFQYYQAKGLDEKEAMKKVATDRKQSKSEIYHELKVKGKV